MGSRRRHAAVLALLVALLALLGAGTAAAAAGPCEVGTYAEGSPAPADPDAIRACLRQLPYASSDPNVVSVDVVITDRASGLPPAVPYGVFLTAHLTGGETGQNPAACQEAHFYTNPEYPRGVYRCSWLVDGPGEHVFTATVNKVGARVTGVQRLLTASLTLSLDDAVAGSIYAPALKYVVEGSNFEVLLLQAHVAAASIWLLMVTVMAFLALPRLRRMCSVLTLHALEVRRGFLASLMWAMFGVVVGTGVYLLRTQTAYEAPWSPSAWDDITKLPYASTYFTTLYVKIAIFVVMAAASVVLAQEAARQARLAGDIGLNGADGADDDLDVWGRLPALGPDGNFVAETLAPAADAAPATAVQVRPRAAAGVSPRMLWACVAVVAGGMGAVGVCVTVLKYTHELIEMLVAAKTISGR